MEYPIIASDSLFEDNQFLLEDFNLDGYKDLFVMSSGWRILPGKQEPVRQDVPGLRQRIYE
ncbi:MAG: hypothetical protein U5K51_05965 [Flavobacteriaceae bacterium]|nr:hypothetical protein [Flavobacteriaceae bacterium]